MWQPACKKARHHSDNNNDNDSRDDSCPGNRTDAVCLWDNHWIKWCWDAKSPRKYYGFPTVSPLPSPSDPLSPVGSVIFYIQEAIFTRTLLRLRSGLFAYLVQCDEHHLGDAVGFYEIHLAHHLEELFQAYPTCETIYNTRRFDPPLSIHAGQDRYYQNDRKNEMMCKCAAS